MCSSPKWKDVCNPETASTFRAADFCTPAVKADDSPIDTYLKATRSLVLIAGATVGQGTSKNIAAAKAEAGRLLLLGLAAETERYFRDILGGLVSLCPITQRELDTDNISLGEALRREGRGVGRALFDSLSFTSERNIRDATIRVVGWRIDKKSAVGKCLSDFQKLCHIRHAAVHSGGQLADHNAIGIGLNPSVDQCLRIEFGGFGSAVQICHNLVRSYNRAANERVIQRWIKDAVFHGTWTQDKHLYGRLFELFFSTIDGNGRRNPYNVYRSLQALIAARLSM